MSRKKVYNFLHFVLVICCFKIVSIEALTTSDRTTNNTSTSQQPTSTSTVRIATNTPEFPTTFPTAGGLSCENLGHVNYIDYNTYHYWFINYNSWYNSSFFGGHMQIPWKGNIDKSCFVWPSHHIAVLKEKHVEIAVIGEEIITAEACILNQTEMCITNLSVEMRVCEGKILYKFVADYNFDYNNYYNTYVCFDRVYEDRGRICENLRDVPDIGNSMYYNMYIGYNTWYNSSIWGGHVQIPWKVNVDESCLMWFRNWYSYAAVLKEKHVNIADIGEGIITAEICIWNQTDECVADLIVEMKVCNGHLLYRLIWSNNNEKNIYYNTIICFDRVYADSCPSSELVYTAGNVTDRFLNVSYDDIQLGWLHTHQKGKQYVLPSYDDVDDVFENCIGIDHRYREHLFLKERMSEDIPEDMPVKLNLCYVYKHYYDYYQDYTDDDYYYDDYCNFYIYARKCDGKIQFDISYLQYHYGSLCFIHYNNVKVVPEIKHQEDKVSDGIINYIPQMQFKCSFEMTGSTAYKVNWYINATLWKDTGYSSNPDDLVLAAETLSQIKLGYHVKCGVIAAGASEERLSDEFYAGWKIPDKSIRLPKNGHAIIEVEQTIPLGCTYTNFGDEKCEEILSVLDVDREVDACKAGIHVINTNDNKTSFHTIKSLKKGDVWTGSIKYRFRLTTIDHDYDDKLNFDMEVLVTKSELAEVVDSERIGITGIEVTHSTFHRYKRCYSHADPHVRTADGRYFGQQLVGDHMFYRNRAYQTEVHEYARYCNNNGGAVCACGIAIRSGADVFVLNRCGSYTILDFLQCNDGGIIDVQRIHDYRYKVTTPIGTVIVINLHSWGRTIDIDIYLSAKDFHNTDGLCGYFDGDRNNDFRHRNGSQSSSSNSYYGYEDFIKSWRLLDEENFLNNASRVLEKWNVNNGATNNPACSDGSTISKNKCQFNREKRKRRETVTQLGKQTIGNKLKSSNNANIREKRSLKADITENEVRELCNNSISSAPAVKEFSDQLADEDTSIVLEQCVYDITHDNSTVWASAHVDSLNSIVI